MKLIKSFSRMEPGKLGLGSLLGCLIVTLLYVSMSKPYQVALPALSFRSPLADGASIRSQQLGRESESKPRCNGTESRPDLCGKDGVVRMNGNSSATTFEPPSEENNANVTQELGKDVEVQGGNMTLELGKGVDVKGGKDANITQELGSNVEVGGGKNANITQELGSSVENLGGSRMIAIDDMKVGQHKIVQYSNVSENVATDTNNSTIEQETSRNAEQLGSDENLQQKQRKPICDVSDRRADYCETRGDIRILGNSSSVLVLGNSETDESYKIRPYARKGDQECMSSVRQVLVKSSNAYGEAPHCDVTHSVPAIVFSIGGYTGNFFHDFTDVLIPLFLTSYQFNGEVQFIITDLASWWIHKYLPIFQKLSRYEIIDFNKENKVHCFSRVMVGLLCHKELSIDPSRAPNGYSMVDFTKFMRNTYSLDREAPMKPKKKSGKRPRLLIVSRMHSRRLMNVDNIAKMAGKLGYEVVVAEAVSNVAQFARIVNSCDVMMGVHGAGLTNLMFLPTNAVLIQIIPFGNLDWIARTYFKEPAKDMKLKYLEYRIVEEESTLIDQYPRDHPVFKDPKSIHSQGWGALREIYLVKQNVKLDLERYKPVLMKAMKLLRQK